MKLSTKLSSILAVFLLVFTTNLFAQVTDGGFETWTVPANPPDNWNVANAYAIAQETVDFHGGAFAVNMPAGDIETDYLYQTISLTANIYYTVSFWADINSGSFGIQAGVFSGSTEIASIEEDQGAGYSQYTFSFTAPSTGSYTLRFASGLGTDTDIDDVSMLPNVAPTVAPVINPTTLEVGYALSLTLNFVDPEDGEGTHLYQWFRSDNSTGLNKIAITGATSATYTLATADVAKYITVKVTPVADGGTTPGTQVETALPVGPIGPNAVPVAALVGAGITNSGAEKEGETLTITFNVSDVDAEQVGWSVKWYRATSAAGANKVLLETDNDAGWAASPQNNVTATYALVYGDVGSYIYAEVTPKSEFGASPGAIVTDATGVIAGFTYEIPTTALPVTNEPAAPIQPTFTWLLPGAPGFDIPDDFQLQVSSDQYFSTIVHSETIAALTTGVISTALNPGQDYYWRVRARATTPTPVRYSPWSQIQKFTTTEVVAPTLSFPVENTTVYTLTPKFYWYMMGYKPNVTYNFDISTAHEAGGGEFAANLIAGLSAVGITDLYYQLPAAPALTAGTYYWTITAVQGANTETSAEGKFVISSTADGIATVPTLSYPTGGTTVYTLTPTLYWYNVTASSGLTYNVEVYSGATLVWSGSPTPTTGLSVTVGTTLSPNTTYTWRVQSDNGVAPSAWTTAESFVTYTPANSGSVVTPTPSWPVGGAEMYSEDVTLNWWLGTYATGLTYEVDVADDAAFTSIVANYTGITGLFKEVTGVLTAGNTYYWRVRSTNGSSYSSYSATESFSISSSATGVLVTPTPMYPSGGVTVFSTTPQLSWLYLGTTAGVTFEVRYDAYPSFPAPVTETSTTVSHTVQITLTAGNTYYWAVRAFDGVNYSAWSTAAEFVVSPSATAPVTPMPGSPVAGVTVDNMQPMLSWFIPANDNNLTYSLEISKDPQFSASNSISYNDISSTSKVISDLESGTVYNWRVRTKRVDGNYSQYSSSSSFMTPGLTGTEDPGLIPTEFAVAQNYPNPFNPSTTINYAIPEAGFITIKIYNMLGQEVRTLLNKEVNAGVYNVKWNGEDNSGSKVSSGTYIYRVEAGKNIVTRKMVLLK